MPENDETRAGSDQPKSENIFSTITGFLSEHPGILGSLIYLQVSAVGIIYAWFLYNGFNINIFDFAETNDFLLAAFKQPFALGMSILTIIFVLILTVGSYIWRSRGRRRTLSPLRSWALLGVFAWGAVFYTAYPPYFYGIRGATAIIQEQEAKVTLRYKAVGPDKKASIEENELSLIGTTDRFPFFMTIALNDRS